MSKKVIFPTIVAIMLMASSSHLSAQTSDEVFDQLKSLAGEWSGTLHRSTGEEEAFKLTYSLRSNGSSILEESDTDGVPMLTIFNKQEESLLVTHYCALMNKPVAKLVSSADGVLSFTTDAARSGLQEGKDQYVKSWTLSLEPENSDQFTYEYTVINPDMTEWTAKAIVSRVK